MDELLKLLSNSLSLPLLLLKRLPLLLQSSAELCPPVLETTSNGASAGRCDDGGGAVVTSGDESGGGGGDKVEQQEVDDDGDRSSGSLSSSANDTERNGFSFGLVGVCVLLLSVSVRFLILGGQFALFTAEWDSVSGSRCSGFWRKPSLFVRSS